MKAAPIFAALGDESRFGIVTKLSNAGPLSISELASDAKISRQAVTKHLHALHRAGLVQSERSGRRCIWKLQPRRLADVRRYLMQISRQWDDALARLATTIEE